MEGKARTGPSLLVPIFGAAIMVGLALAMPALAVPRQAAPAAVAEQPELGLLRESRPEDGLIAAGQPTEEQLRAAAAAGVRTVIDLRAEGEERGFDEALAAEQLGLRYLMIPVTASTLDEPATYEALFEALGEAERPILLHCGSSNRVGALYYAYLVAEKGVAPVEALERGKAAGMRSVELQERVEAFLSTREARDH